MYPNPRAHRFTIRRRPNLEQSSENRPTPKPSLHKALVGGAVLCLLLGARSELAAQDVAYPTNSQQNYSQDQPYSPQSYSPDEQQPAPIQQPLNSDQVEQLVAPIALYPDPLVAQILAASTYPQQVQAADQWRQERAGAPPEQIAAEADAQPWDPSVKALTAFPQVLAQMDRNLQWTTDLGNAYYNQPQDLLEAVQVMRRRAQAAGNLQSTPQEVVRDNPGYIEVVPANPQVVYVPAYNPWTIYGDPVTPYPGFSALGVLGDILEAPLQFGAGIAMAAFSSTPWGWLAWGLDWLGHELLFDHSEYYCHSDSVVDWGFGHRGFYAYGGRGGFGRGWEHRGMRGGGWRGAGGRWHGGRFAGKSSGRGGMGNRGGWHSFSRGNAFAGNSRGWNSFRGGNAFAGNSRGWNSFSRGNGSSNNWRAGSSGFRGFKAVRGGMNSRGFGNSFQNSRSTYAGNFHRAPANGFRGNGFGSWSSGRSSSHFGSYKPSRGSWGGWGGSHGQRGFGNGSSQKALGGRGWGGFGSHGGGHAPKGFGGGGHFGGGHSF